MGKKRYSGDFRQVLFNIIIIGIFSIAKEWVAAHDSGSWVVGIIFTFLTMLMFCLLAINIYNCMTHIRSAEPSKEDRQIQALLYKQIKKLEEQMPGLIAEHSGRVSKKQTEHKFEELKLNQLRSVKAILAKIEEIQAQQEKLMKLYGQAETAPVVTEEAESAAEEAGEIFVNEAALQKDQAEEFLPEKSQENEPIPEQQTAAAFIAEAPVLEEPAFDESLMDELVSEEPAIDESLMDELVTEEPVFDESLIDELVMEEPVLEESLIEELISQEEPAKEQAVEEAETESSSADDPLAALLSGEGMGDPNRELTPDEIAALFSGID